MNDKGIYIGDLTIKYRLPVTKTVEKDSTTTVSPYLEASYSDWRSVGFEVYYRIVFQTKSVDGDTTAVYTWKQLRDGSNDFWMDQKAYKSRMALHTSLPMYVAINSENAEVVRELESAMKKLLTEYGVTA